MDDLAGYIALALAPGIGPVRLRSLLEVCKTPDGAFSAPFALLGAVPGFSRAAATSVRGARRKEGEEILRRTEALGGTVLTPFDRLFPAALHDIPDAPALLFLSGDSTLLERPAVAIVGSRDHSPYGSTVCCLVAARERDKPPPFWLILVMPLWANLHGSFAFGLALAGALAVEAVVEAADRAKAARAWGLFLLGAAVSAMATPFGFRTLLFPFQLSAMQGLAFIGEWQASDLSHLSPLLLALLASLFVLGSGKVKVAPLRLLLFVGLMWLALAHQRHQMLLGVTAPILLAPFLAKAWPPVKDEIHPPLFGALAALGFVVLIALRVMVPVVRGDDPRSPVSALAQLPPQLRQQPVLNDYSFSGYLIWAGIKVYIDSRADFYGDGFVKNYAQIASADRDALAASLSRSQARWTIFARDTPMAKLMDGMPGWRRSYSDKLAVIHVHD
jgi:hypothetical protein